MYFGHKLKISTQTNPTIQISLAQIILLVLLWHKLSSQTKEDTIS